MADSSLCKQIIEKELLTIYFQTILSHHDAFPLGVESFVKASHPMTGELISPADLFVMADNEQLTIELDLLIIQKTLDVFKYIYSRNKDALLFINVSESIINFNDPMGLLLSIVTQSGINPESIAFDIADYPNTSVNDIIDFITKFREHGFYISIDDIGKNYFNLDRILLLNPDIIKISHQYMARLNQNDYTRRILKHIGRIAHEMGMIVVDTGIESDKELEYAYEQGAQYFQGYFIHKPEPVTAESVDDFLQMDATLDLVMKYRTDAVIEEMRPFMNKMILFLSDLRSESSHWHSQKLNKYIDKIFAAHPSIENGWIIDKSGVQISRAMINNEGFSSRNAAIFNIHGMGHDYSDSDFYRLLSSGALDVWITKPYRSLLSNSTCVTTSSFIELEGAQQLTLCLVFNYDMFKKAYM